MSLYVVHDQGKLVEYTLEVRPKNGNQTSDETVIELFAQPRIEWHLKRYLLQDLKLAFYQ